jgi:hypothetical protein
LQGTSVIPGWGAISGILVQAWSNHDSNIRFNRLEKVVIHLQNILSQHSFIYDRDKINSDEFATFAIRIKTIAENDHRKFKHHCLAWMLANSVKDDFKFSFTKQEYFLKIVDYIGPQHLEILHLLRDTLETPVSWDYLVGRAKTLPEPQEQFLIITTKYLLSEGLIQRKGGVGMTIIEGKQAIGDSDLGVSRRGKWGIKKFGLEFLEFIGNEDSSQIAIDEEFYQEC